MWLIIVCLLIGLAYAAALYFRDTTFKETTGRLRFLKPVMFVARGLAVSIIALLLIGLFIKTTTTTTLKPIVVVLQDQSASIDRFLNGQDSIEYVQRIDQLKSELAEEYDVYSYAFGSKLSDEISHSYGFKATNLSRALESVNDLYYNQNLGAIVLATDGIYNEGANPIYSNVKSGTPVYSIALGDTSRKRDVKVVRVLANKITYLNDRFAVNAEISTYFTNGEVLKAQIGEVKNGSFNVLSTEEFTVESAAQVFELNSIIEATNIGLRHYQVRVDPVNREEVLENNVFDFFVEVLDSRQKILILAQAPHPDVSAIRSALNEQKNYEVDVKYATEDFSDLGAYSLLIAHQIPSIHNDGNQLFTLAEDQKIPVLHILGSLSDINAFNKVQNTLEIKASAANPNLALPSLNPDFGLFTTGEDMQLAMSKWPPLSVPFGEYQTKGNSNTLLAQRLGSVVTDYPLIMFSEDVDRKSAVIVGEGIWKWRLQNFQNSRNHEAFNKLVNQTVQFLATKADKRKFRAAPIKNVFGENERISFQAEVYNDNYERVTDTEVSINLTDESGNSYPFTFSVVGNRYQLDAGFLPPGSYTYRASTSRSGKEENIDGSFVVSPVQLESLNTKANHQILHMLAQQNGGQVFLPENTSAVAATILGENQLTSRIEEIFKSTALINFKWLLFFLVILLGIEWFIRKYLGAY